MKPAMPLSLSSLPLSQEVICTVQTVRLSKGRPPGHTTTPLTAVQGAARDCHATSAQTHWPLSRLRWIS